MKIKSRKKMRRFVRRQAYYSKPMTYAGAPIRYGKRTLDGKTAKAAKGLKYFRRKMPLI